MKLLSGILIALAGLQIFSTAAQAQSQVGRCVDRFRGQSFVVLSNNYVFQEGFPQNGGMAMRDPSGQTFLRLPSRQPSSFAYFVGWRGELVEISSVTGRSDIGQCQFGVDFLLPDPNMRIWSPPILHPTAGVELPNGTVAPIPQAIVDPDRPYWAPMMTGQASAYACWQSSGSNRSEFAGCLLRIMASPQERDAFYCARAGGGPEAVSICMVGVFGGERERRIAQTLADCRRQYGSDYSRYPLCMAAEQVGGDAAKLIACVQQQMHQQGQVTFMGTAMCYGAAALNLNAEAQIVAQCAVTSNGDGYTFAACAGGQLTAREIDKCFTHGVGGDSGCFGPNNAIVQHLQSMGKLFNQQFGPNNDIVRMWDGAVNDFGFRVGPTHVVRQTISNVANEAQRAGGNVVREASRRLPKIRL